MRVIQYSEASVMESKSRGVLDRPVKPDDDSALWSNEAGRKWNRWQFIRVRTRHTMRRPCERREDETPRFLFGRPQKARAFPQLVLIGADQQVDQVARMQGIDGPGGHRRRVEGRE